MPEQGASGPIAAPALVLSAVEFDVVWRSLGLGPPPVVLQLPSPGRTHTERRRIEAEVWTALRGRGLAGCDLEQVLCLLAAPALRIEVRAWGGSPLRSLVTGTNADGLVALRRDDAVVLQRCTSMSGAVTALLAGPGPGAGRAASVPSAELEAALRRPSGPEFRADLAARGVDPTEAGLVARMLHGIDRRAQITVAVPDRWGILRRSGELLEVLDGPRGRYLATRSRGADGTSWTSVAPVDDRRLRHRIAELLERPAVSPDRRVASAACRPR